jgi:hypothetical protein
MQNIVVTIRCRMRCFVLLSVLSVIASGCAGGGPTAPSTRGPTAAFTRGNLEINSMGVSNAGQGALGNWQYKVTVHLRETGGVDMTVTNIQVQALFGSHILATARAIPMLSVLANSSSDAGVVFNADTQVSDLSALTIGMTVQFRDANGNTGSVSKSFTCFGCWDY